MASSGRYISPRDFGVLIADLRLASTIFQERLLEFLEQQRIVVPVARIRWPTAVVVEAREGPTVPSTDEEKRQSSDLADALRLWHRFDSDPDLAHPLDRDHQPGVDLISMDVTSRPFEPWENFRTNIRPEGEEPAYVPDAVDTYYHDWQVLLVADALDMGTRVVFDTRRPELMKLALRGDIGDLPGDVAWQEVSFQGPRGLTHGLQWAKFFDASARVESARTRKLNAISRTHHSASFTLAGADLDDFNAAQKRVAEAALAAIGATSSQSVAFLTYLCERWDEWTGRGRQEVAAEYKRQIALAARMVMHAQNRDFPALAKEVGRVTGHFENTLDVVFPDWKKEAREKTELSLKHAVISKAPSADVNLTLTEADVSNVLDWLERIDLWKIHLSIETILARQFSNSRVDRTALAKKVESMSTTFEHVVNALLGEAGVLPVRTLMIKIQRFWNAVPEIHSILMNEHGLVSTGTKTRAAQVASIETLPAAGPNINVARTILKAVLYRNDGQHNAMTSWSEDELHEANRVFLTAIMFCRKNLLTNPPT